MLLCIYHLLQPDRRIDEGIDAILKKEEKSTLYAAVAKLSPAEINLMTSLYLCDDPIGQREYARRHGVAVTTINHQLTVALKKLKKMLPN